MHDLRDQSERADRARPVRLKSFQCRVQLSVRTGKDPN